MKYLDFPVTFDELAPEGHLLMRKATYEALTGEPVEEPAILHRKTGDISARITRFTAATRAVTADPEGTMRMPDGSLTEPASAHEITLAEQGPDEAPCEDAEETPEHEWIRKEQEANEHPAA